ncbi:hypothetical protein I316_04464 [Kwoniella heveanensis BCC8398]|uniref:Uncharacterized protein n=1 Tax=Kwoniella heveanensis BCC8398 TaxID=1296120 RepID=A0A1B9GRR7_9TREE|nr:hypothetical protein I316_04464 [Kwoniella heveanensis BCC8398]
MFITGVSPLVSPHIQYDRPSSADATVVDRPFSPATSSRHPSRRPMADRLLTTFPTSSEASTVPRLVYGKPVTGIKLVQPAEQTALITPIVRNRARPDTRRSSRYDIDAETFAKLNPVHYLIFAALRDLAPPKTLVSLDKAMYVEISPKLCQTIAINRKSMLSVQSRFARLKRYLLTSRNHVGTLQCQGSPATEESPLCSETSSEQTTQLASSHTALDMQQRMEAGSLNLVGTAVKENRSKAVVGVSRLGDTYDRISRRHAFFDYTSELTFEDWDAIQAFARDLAETACICGADKVAESRLFPNLHTLNIRWPVIEGDVKSELAYSLGRHGRSLDRWYRHSYKDAAAATSTSTSTSTASPDLDLPSLYALELEKKEQRRIATLEAQPFCSCGKKCLQGDSCPYTMFSSVIRPRFRTLNIEIEPSALTKHMMIEFDDHLGIVVGDLTKLGREDDCQVAVNYMIHFEPARLHELHIPEKVFERTTFYLIPPRSMTSFSGSLASVSPESSPISGLNHSHNTSADAKVTISTQRTEAAHFCYISPETTAQVILEHIRLVQNCYVSPFLLQFRVMEPGLVHRTLEQLVTPAELVKWGSNLLDINRHFPLVDALPIAVAHAWSGRQMSDPLPTVV